MTDSRIPEGLTSILSQMETLIRRSYAEGYHRGVSETTDRMFRAVAVGAEQRLTSIGGEMIPLSQLQGDTEAIGKQFNGHRVRRGASTVISRVRQALVASGGVGITPEELLTYCRNKGMDVTPQSIKEAVRQLLDREEATRANGVVYAGPRLKDYISPPEPAGRDNYDGEGKGEKSE